MTTLHHHDEITMLPQHPTSEIPPEFETTLTAFLDASIRHILRHESLEAYQAELGALLRRSGFDAWCDDDTPRWVLGHAIWNATPLPTRGFHRHPLPAPKRNDACPCGSGQKFKRCCQPRLEAVGADPLDSPSITQRAVGLLTRAQRQDALAQGPAEIRLAIAAQELEERRPGKARDILKGLLSDGGLPRQHQAEAVYLLGEAYSTLGHAAAGEKTFQQLLPRLKGQAASAALHWLASHYLEQERPDRALPLIKQADAADPDRLTTGMLLVVALRALGEDEAAREAAADWLEVAEACGEPEAIELLREQASLDTLDDMTPLDSLEGEDDPLGCSEAEFEAITRRLEQAGHTPLLPVRFEPGPEAADGTGQEWMLMLPARVQSAEAVFYRDPDGANPLDLSLIERHPALLQSPAFLEELGEASLELLFHDRRRFNRALVHQLGRITQHVLAALPEGGQLPWGWLEHRPVLRTLFQSGLDQPDPDRAIPIFRRVLALCPNDNLGVRAPLINALLKVGHDEEALALAEGYAGDHLAETRYGPVLALVRLGRLHEAEAALAEAYRALPKVLDYLIAKKRKRPKLNPHGVTIGGPDQAWLYRQEMRETFAATQGLLEWLGQVKRRLPHPAPAR